MVITLVDFAVDSMLVLKDVLIDSELKYWEKNDAKVVIGLEEYDESIVDADATLLDEHVASTHWRELVAKDI